MPRYFLTMFEFGCELFGYEETKNMSADRLNSFYEDWKRTEYDIKLYKKLLITRG